ncbi:hypothetical protein LOAG_10910 [Loa loa]|uniref:Uncharacterized protein n=1 Tax=Loa loa TaxID=7209 RepID=A0A1S0TNZ5_LOALO|nr:hypothetical protein LOAG_10910 [Loa loa]EFO17590.1 hypothetical protein LOAG_10910 [Loa loa]
MKKTAFASDIPVHLRRQIYIKGKIKEILQLWCLIVQNTSKKIQIFFPLGQDSKLLCLQIAFTDDATVVAYTSVIGNRRIWCNKYLGRSAKFSTYKSHSTVLSISLHESESWAIFYHHLLFLERFPPALPLYSPSHPLCSMVNWSPQNKNHKKGVQGCLETILELCPYRLPSVVAGMDYSVLESEDVDIIHNAAASFENTHRIRLEDKKRRKKNRTSSKSPKKAFRCTFCNQTCLSCSDLLSHHACSVGITLHVSSFGKLFRDGDYLHTCRCSFCGIIYVDFFWAHQKCP